MAKGYIDESTCSASKLLRTVQIQAFVVLFWDFLINAKANIRCCGSRQNRSVSSYRDVDRSRRHICPAIKWPLASLREHLLVESLYDIECCQYGCDIYTLHSQNT